MPKQLSAIQIRGRLDNNSYYKVKNLHTPLLRKIDPNASQRVKTQPQYATFRANASEFGMTSNWVNVFKNMCALGSFQYNNQYWSAFIIKNMLPELDLDTTHEIGTRTYKETSLERFDLLLATTLKHDISSFFTVTHSWDAIKTGTGWNITHDMTFTPSPDPILGRPGQSDVKITTRFVSLQFPSYSEIIGRYTYVSRYTKLLDIYKFKSDEEMTRTYEYDIPSWEVSANCIRGLLLTVQSPISYVSGVAQYGRKNTSVVFLPITGRLDD